VRLSLSNCRTEQIVDLLRALAGMEAAPATMREVLEYILSHARKGVLFTLSTNPKVRVTHRICPPPCPKLLWTLATR
jgi:hypothetical protein